MLFLLIILLVLLVILAGIFSAAETSLFSLSPMRVQAFRKSTIRRENQAAELLYSPRDLLITLLMVNVIINISVQNVVSNIFGTFSGWLLTVGVPLGLLLVFGDFIPKSVGIANNDWLAPRLSPFLTVLKRGLLPIRKPMIALTSIISRILFFFLKDEKEISMQELQHVLQTSSESGVLAADEAELMRGYLNLQGSNAKGFMRPREEVLFFDLNEPLTKLIHLFVDQECTRIPICDGEIDNVVGIITSGKFFLHREAIHETKDLLPLLIKPFFLPETTSAQALLDQMYERRQSLGIVVDEYGAFAGLIALEDLVEAVVGEIFDRRDEKARYTRSGEDVIIASGKLELMELEHLFDVELDSENNMVTIGGWLTEKLGDIPRSGHKFRWKKLLFHVLSSDEKRVRRVYIRRLSEK